jgi:autotransporter-associated beta strand protein/T5SS/PEP-CTERM-associated repeat protein
MLEGLLVDRASLGLISDRKGSVLTSAWALGLALAGLLVMGLPTTAVRADTTIDSGTTTVSTGTNFGGTLYVATTGTATLEVIAGGYATNTNGFLGFNAGGNGTATVSSGTWDNSGNLYVGWEGSGTLTVNGGSVTNTIGYIGFSGGSVGTATVSSGTWANGGELSVGENGNGTLTVNGGLVTNSTGVLGGGLGAMISVGTATATVSSGTWANSGDLFVGYSGTGTLTVNGGSVTNFDAYLGYSFGGVGTATVSSGTWANSGGLYVGVDGTGTLKVTGGSVTNSIGSLGDNAGNVGTATVSSGTWENYGELYVGRSGTGTLTVNGGSVTVGGTLSKGTYGTINLNAGGTLQIGVGGAGGVLGVSTLVNNGTLIFNRSDASTYSGIINGTGAVTKQGAGTLTLGGANSYSGVTTISGGVLALSGTGSVGTGDLNLGYGGVFDLTALASGTYSLPSTGDLIGSGTLTGNGHTLAVLGAFQPGNSPGTVTLDTGFTLDLSGGASTTFDITDPLFTAGTYDLVNGNGSMIFGGVLNLAFSGGSYADGTDVLQLFANTGGFSGDFTSVVSTGLAAGQFATFNAATGSISVVPEPSTYAMALAGLACSGWQMWRRRRLKAA